MKVLVCARHFGYLRNFESALVELAARGHTLSLVADRDDTAGGTQMVQRLAARFSGVSVGWTPPRDRSDQWFDLAAQIRLSQDYLRYLDRAYNKAPMLRRRAKDRTPAFVVWLVERAGFRYRPGRAMLSSLLRALEDGVPLHERYSAFLREAAPDVVMLTPLIDLGSPQLDMLKSAQALGMRTVLAVGSWDHLSSKALIRLQPDLITVWNEVQKHEAVDMHGVPADRVVVTGAQCYDQWFNRQPSRSREAFCRDMGLPPDRPFALYVCSSLFRGDPPEADFTVRWINAVRGSRDPRLAHVGILVRPHPGRMDEWKGHDVAALGVPFHGHNPITDEARGDYFDALYFCAAVVGLNTSAFLEAGIAGKPVLAILPKEIWKSQEGTLHFHYLLTVGGGLLRTSRSLEEHLTQLAAAVSGTVRADNTPFVREFIRPFGLDVAASPRFADAIERLVASPAPQPRRPSLAGRAVSPVLWTAVAIRRSGDRRHKFGREVVRASKKTGARAQRTLERSRRRVRDAATSARLWLHPSTTRRTLITPENFERTDEFGQLIETLARARSSSRPVVVGPWLSEVGFELLYWIPFLRWAKTYAQIRGDRIVVLSRGGTASWYRDIGARYVDALELCSLDDFRARAVERIAVNDGQKHFGVAPFDEDLLARLRRHLGLGEVEWLHPGLMYKVFRSFWTHVASSELVRRYSIPRSLLVEPAEKLHVPSSYVAVKLYANAGLPDGEDTRTVVRDVLARLVNRTPIVLLESGLRIDDHDDFGVDRSDRIVRIDELLTPATNLGVQTQIVAGASALLCTYGGFSYLGPLCGVPTVALYSDPQAFRLDHLAVAQRTFRQLSSASFVTLSLQDLAFARQTLGRPLPMEVFS